MPSFGIRCAFSKVNELFDGAATRLARREVGNPFNQNALASFCPETLKSAVDVGFELDRLSILAAD